LFVEVLLLRSGVLSNVKVVSECLEISLQHSIAENERMTGSGRETDLGL
jgi:hypothetical protein